MRNPLHAGLAILLALLLALAGGCSREPRHPAIPPGSSVLAIGNSVTYGTGADPGRDYPARLASLTGWTLHNHGIPGDTSEGVKDRLDAALAETAPALVLLEIGGNDFLRRIPDGVVAANLRATLRQLKARGIPVVLVAVPQFSPLGAVLGKLPDAPLYADLAREEDVVLVPQVFADVLSQPELRADPIHPNSAGYARLAEGIAARLAEAGFLGRR